MNRKIMAFAVSAVTALAAVSTPVCASEASPVQTEISESQARGIVSEQFPDLDESSQASIADEVLHQKYGTAGSGREESKAGGGSDEAYEHMLTRENYVVDLINATGEKTTSGDWEFNLDYLEQHYDELISDERVNRQYLDLYIETYEPQKAVKDLPDYKARQEKNLLTSSSYNYSSAVSYAEKYYSSYNSVYPDWSNYGGDCTNFISQCLHAGGKSMVGTPGTSAAASNRSNWFSSGTSCDTTKVSSTWRSSSAFMSYWQSHASGYSTFSSVGSSSYSYGYKGDAVSLLNSNGAAYRTLIIVGYDAADKDFIVATHTGNTKTKSLSSYNAPGGFIIYSMR